MNKMNLTNERIVMLAKDIADYLSSWTDDENSIMSFDDSIQAIERYGVSFSQPDEKLVKASIRHLIDIINPWNKSAVLEILEECAIFTKDEANYYHNNLYE
ncbi:MAG: hypothetical protein LBU51_06030 [Bacteroidales bacterium]|jgi:hypothetical protein|nr:hypothetical protein [Bacteroidales bacterium]